MPRFFVPAMAVLNRLTFAEKFVLIGALVAVPFAVAVALLIGEVAQAVEFGEKELTGSAYLQSLRPLVEHLERHRDVSYRLSHGESALQGDLLALQARIEEDLDAAGAMEHRPGAALGVTESWAAFKGKWQPIRSGVFRLSAQAGFDLQTALIRDVLGRIAQAGARSHLLLDPDPKSYYLAEVVVTGLPLLTERLAQARSWGRGALQYRPLTPHDRLRLSTVAALIEETQAALRRNVGIALRENPGLTAELDSALSANDAATAAFLRLLTSRLIDTEHPDLSPEEYWDAGATALDASGSLYDRTSTALDRVLQARLSTLRMRQYGIGLLTLGIGIVGAYLFTVLCLSVRSTICRLEEGSEGMGQRRIENSAVPPTESRDETGQATGVVNASAQRRRGEWAQAECARATSAETALREQNAALHGLVEVARRLTAEPDLDRLLKEITDMAQRLTGAKYAALGVFDETGAQLTRLITVGIGEMERQAIGVPPSGRGLLGHLAHEDGVLRLKDLTAHQASVGFPSHHPPMRSFLGMSIRVRGRLYGRLYLTEKTGAPSPLGAGEAKAMEFTELDERIVTALAAQAGVSIENAAILNEIRESESALRDSRQRLQAIMDNATAVIFLKDPQGRYLLVNRRYETLFHVTNEAIVGKTDYDLFPKDRADALRANDLKVLQAGLPIEVEEVVPHEDGLHTYLSIKFPLYDAQMVSGGVCGIATDITERKAAEETLKVLNQSLRAANQEIEEMSSIIAHDLKAPLITIQGYADRLATGYAEQVGEKGRRDLTTIREVSVVLGQMVDGLLDVTRIHRRELRPQRCDLSTVVDRVLAGLSEQVRAAGASIAREWDPAVADVWADPVALYRVFSNLIGNALKFSAPDRPLYVRIGSQAREGHVVLWVRDNGIGIPADKRVEVFRMFRKLNKKAPGTGLGLAAVKKLVQQTGGQVWIESTPGDGTTVCFTVPLSCG